MSDERTQLNVCGEGEVGMKDISTSKRMRVTQFLYEKHDKQADEQKEKTGGRYGPATASQRKNAGWILL